MHHCFNSPSHIWVFKISNCYITETHSISSESHSRVKLSLWVRITQFSKSIKTLKLIWSKPLWRPWLCWHQSWCRLNGWCSNNANGSSGLIFRVGLLFIEATAAPVVTPRSALNSSSAGAENHTAQDQIKKCVGLLYPGPIRRQLHRGP